MMGSMRVEVFYIKFLVREEAHLFMTDLEKEDFLYFPPEINSWMPIAGMRFLP